MGGVPRRVRPPKAGHKEARFITPKEVERLIWTIKADAEVKGGLVQPRENLWMIDVIRFAVCTGIRRGEFMNLR